jgi:hypothetical protein
MMVQFRVLNNIYLYFLIFFFIFPILVLNMLTFTFYNAIPYSIYNSHNSTIIKSIIRLHEDNYCLSVNEESFFSVWDC